MSAARRGGDGGALAIVLHTHMPYVEGYGTWPFGEEWLWEAIACCYLPLLDLLARDAPLTLSLTPVLCDQLEVAGLAARFGRFVREVRSVTHERDAAGLRAAGSERLAAAVERSESDYTAASSRLEAIGGDLIGALGAHAQWTSAATHAVLPLLATDAGLALQLRTGTESHRRRFGAWRGGLWLPECAYAPWLQRPLEQAGTRAVCVELTSAYGLGAREHLRPCAGEAGVVLVPLDRELISLVWSERGYPAAGAYRDYHHLTIHHHNPWSNDGGAYEPQRARALARRHAADFVARARARLARAREQPGPPLPGGGLAVCALDTELLGHWWYEGPLWLEAVVEECSRQRLTLVRLDDALERDAGAPPPAPSLPRGAVSWGAGGDLSTWSGPAVAELAVAARSAELRALARGAGAVAARELLALQASDWAFMVSRSTAPPYARKRFAAHLAAFEHALAATGGEEGAGPRNLAARADAVVLRAPG